MPKVPQTRSDKPTKTRTLDRLHAATQKEIERLPKSMTRTYSNSMPAVSKPQPSKQGSLARLDKLGIKKE